VVPRYGAIWVPRGVAVGWAPYSAGRWIHDPYYGWSWVDAASWGWAPYHYGRWVHVSGYWGWAPGPVVVRPRYAPALVAFFGGGGLSVGFSIGAPHVGWVALGWGEPIVPWWGPRGVRGVPRWAGWGGPRVVNKVVVKSRTVIHVKDIRHYQHTHRRNAFVAVDRKHFGRRALADRRIRTARVEKYAPLRGELDLRPDREHRVASSRAAQRPPRKRQKGSVVAARKPRVAPVSKREAAREKAGSKRPQKERVRKKSGDDELGTPQEPPRRRSERSREASRRKDLSTRSPNTRERRAPAMAPSTRERRAPAVAPTRARKPQPKPAQLARAEAPEPQAPRATRRAAAERRATRGRSAKPASVRSGKKVSAGSNAPDLPREPESRVSRKRGKQGQPKAEKAPEPRRNAKASRKSRRERERGRRS